MLKDAGKFFEAETERIKSYAKDTAAQSGRPYIYLESAHTHASGQSKEAMARAMAERDGIGEGLVCSIEVLEACTSFAVVGNHRTHRLEVRLRQRKCLHLYWYLIPILHRQSLKLLIINLFLNMLALKAKSSLSHENQ